MNEKKKDAVINLRISSDLKKRLADKCWERRMKMTSAIEDAIEQWLDHQSIQPTQNIQSIQPTQHHENATQIQPQLGLEQSHDHFYSNDQEISSDAVDDLQELKNQLQAIENQLKEDRETTISLIKEIIADAQVPIWDAVFDLEDSMKGLPRSVERKAKKTSTAPSSNQFQDTEGLTVAQIAQYYRVHIDTIRKQARKQGIANLGDQLFYQGEVWEIVKVGYRKRLKQLKAD